jgi:hypothetical protein
MELAQIITMSKELMMQFGDHPPMLYVEPLEGKIDICILDDLPEIQGDRQCLLFGMGREMGQAKPDREVLHVYLVTEMWCSITEYRKGEDTTYSRPSEDPNRQEHLVILHCNVKKEESAVHSYQILRSEQLDTVDLLSIGEKSGPNLEDNLLPFFVQGLRSAHLTDRDFMNMILRKSLRKN